MSEFGVAVVIDDDADIRVLLEGILLQSGFEVHTASAGREGVDLVRDVNPNVVTLDLGLPDIDGFEVLRRIRSFSNVHVVILTGRTEEADVLTALGSGADDYITKPFRPREVRARIAAMMRRARLQTWGEEWSSPRRESAAPGNFPSASQSKDSVLRHNGLELDCRTRKAAVDGVALELTRSEFDILEELLRGAGAVVSKNALARALRGQNYQDDSSVGDSDERAVEVHIRNLRRKLHDGPESPRWLETVRGVGYRMVTDQ